MAKPFSPVSSRFWTKVNRSGSTPAHRPELGPCWVWTAGTFRSGYGQFGVGGRNGHKVSAHRLSWEMDRGPIPEGLCCLHHCDNPACVNPRHLFLGSKSDNNIDKVSKDREPRGEAHRQSKLRAADVHQIRAIENVSQSTIARQFNISQTQVSRIRRGTNWAKAS